MRFKVSRLAGALDSEEGYESGNVILQMTEIFHECERRQCPMPSLKEIFIHSYPDELR